LTSPWIIVAGGFHQKGGMDKANLALAEYLLEQETPVHLIAHSVEPYLLNHPLVKVHLVSRPANSFLLGEFALAARANSLVRKIVRERPDARVVVNGGNCIFPGINWAHYVHHAWSGSRHGRLLYKAKDAISETWAKHSERAAFRKASLVIANSERTAREIVEYFGVDRSRVHVVYLGSDPEWGLVSAQERTAARRALQFDGTRPVAAFVGGLGYDHRKGFDVLFRAWQKLCARPDWDVDLVVAGSGPAMPAWRAAIAESGLSERIRLLGFSEKVKDLLAAVDVLVSPVRYEAYGLNVQEAICRGIPALVSASAGVAERYESSLTPMLLPDSEDVDDLVQRLLEWRLRKEEWHTRFQSLSRRLRARTWRDTAIDFVALVEEEFAAGPRNVTALAGNPAS